MAIRSPATSAPPAVPWPAMDTRWTWGRSWDPRIGYDHDPHGLTDVVDGILDGQEEVYGVAATRMGGFWDVVAKVAPVAGGIVGGMVGGPAGAAAGAAGGAAAAAVIKGRAKEAIAKAEEALDIDIPPIGEAIAEAVIGNGGSVDQAVAEIKRRVVSGDLAARGRASFVGDNSALRSSMVSLKTGKPLAAPLAARAALPTSYSTRAGVAPAGFAPAGFAPQVSSSVATAPAQEPSRLPMLVAGAAVLAGVAYLATRKGR